MTDTGDSGPRVPNSWRGRNSGAARLPFSVHAVHPTEKSQPRLADLARLAQRLGGDRLFLLAARLAYSLRVQGAEHIPAAGPCILAFNHESAMTDALVFVIVHRVRRNVHFFGWQNLRDEHPMLDFLSRFGEPNLGARYLRAYWLRGLSAGELLRARRVLLDGEAIMITAEGEWTWDGRFQRPLAPGSAWLALRTGAPVVPIVTTGGYDVQPRWRLDKMNWTGRVTLTIGPPLRFPQAPVDTFSPNALNEANERIWQAMAALLPPAKVARTQERQ